jgi:UDP-glucose 4-epimerase
VPELGTVLVTGGAGYIGSHTCVTLLQAGWSVVVVDNLSNSSRAAIDRIQELATGDLRFEQADLADRPRLEEIFAARPISAVIHFAGLKAVGESVQDPLAYYANNVAGTLNLLGAMRVAGVRDIVFSSSATVYGDPETVPITESAPTGATNPYGRTKLHIEQIIGDVATSEPGWRAFLLRYFNPVGAHPSGRIGEDPKGVPNNLMPFVMQVAVGRRPELVVFGDDYPTPDGTCVRDYIHVEDLAGGHLAALEALDRIEGAVAVNLGTGVGSSVLDVVAATEAVIGRPIPRVIGPRRPGDVPATFADASLARDLLGWEARRTLLDMCADHWRWQQANPHGYGA